jgi:glutathione peroxidase
MNRLKKILLGLLLFVTAFLIDAFYITRNSVNMTTRQKLLKAAYPVVMWFSNLAKSPKAILNNDTAMPAVSFYSLTATIIDGIQFDFSTLKGKKIMLVNTASDCGFTDQYAELEKLYQQYKGQLEIIAFPANDFKEQEKGDNAAIATFCKKNYGVTFPIMSKTAVIKSSGQDLVFKWLTDPAANGWNSKAPSWNFCKYLVNEKGQLTHFFKTSISPLSEEVKAAIEKQ